MITVTYTKEVELKEALELALRSVEKGKIELGTTILKQVIDQVDVMDVLEVDTDLEMEDIDLASLDGRDYVDMGDGEKLDILVEDDEEVPPLILKD